MTPPSQMPYRQKYRHLRQWTDPYVNRSRLIDRVSIDHHFMPWGDFHEATRVLLTDIIRTNRTTILCRRHQVARTVQCRTAATQIASRPPSVIPSFLCLKTKVYLFQVGDSQLRGLRISVYYSPPPLFYACRHLALVQ